MPLFIIVIAFNLEDIFLFFFDDVDGYTCYRRVIVTTLLLSPTTLKTIFLAVLVFFASLALRDRRLFGVFATKYINRRGISGLSLFEVLFGRFLPMKILGVNFPST